MAGMKVEAIHSFLVHPDKGAEKQSAIRGTRVTEAGPLLSMLTDIFEAAPDECRHDIIFVRAPDGSQRMCVVIF